MRWVEVCAAHPDQWLLIEALDAHTEDRRRMVDRIAVVENCADGAAALRRYRELRREHRDRELYFVHTAKCGARYRRTLLDRDPTRSRSSSSPMSFRSSQSASSKRDASIPGIEMLVDSGSASTILSADVAAEIGIVPQPGDRLRRLRGAGHEVVFTRRVDRFEVGSRGLDGFELEIGAMEYGFEIGGILGMDFHRSAGAILNLRDLTPNLS